MIVRLELQCHADIQKPIIDINASFFQQKDLALSYFAVIQQFYSKK